MRTAPQIVSILLLFCVVALLARRAGAAVYFGPCDLDSLCYSSTDVVEADIVKHVPSVGMVDDSLTVLVVDPIEGAYHVGDQVTLFYGSEWYVPDEIEQHFFVFLDRDYKYDRLQPGAVDDADILLIDDHGRVRRYSQFMNPGPLLAEGYDPWGKIEHDDSELIYPAARDVRAAIVAKWTADKLLEPLLSRPATKADVPALMNALRTLRSERAGDGDRDRFEVQIPRRAVVGDHGLEDVICGRICDSGDPSLALDAITAVNDYSEYLGGASWTPFKTPEALAYVRGVLADAKEPMNRRIAASVVLADMSMGNNPPTADDVHDSAALIAAATAAETPEALRLTIISRLEIKQPETAAALRQYYPSVSSEEVKFAIEKAFHYDYDGDKHYATLDSAPKPVLAIVRRSPYLPTQPGHLALQAEVIQVSQSRTSELTWQYVFTNMSTGAQTRVDLGDSTYREERVDRQIPLPAGMRSGNYRVALEFRIAGKHVGTSHTAILPIAAVR